MLRCRIWLPAVQLIFFMALTLYGSPHRETWIRWILGAPEVGTEPSYVDGLPSVAIELAGGINFPASAVAAVLCAGLYTAQSGAAQKLVHALIAMPLVVVLWFWIGRWIDQRGLQNPPPLWRTLHVAGALLLWAIAAYLVAHAGNWAVGSALILAWVLFSIFLLARGMKCLTSPWLVLGVCSIGTVGQALASFRWLETYRVFRLVEPLVCSSSIAWTGLFTAPPLALFAGWLLSRRWPRTAMLPVVFCPFLLAEEFFAFAALGGNWHFLTASLRRASPYSGAVGVLLSLWIRQVVMGLIAAAAYVLIARQATGADIRQTCDSQTPAASPPAGARH